MIEFERHKLENGLEVILHQEKNVPQVVTNLLYHVGSRNEDPERTGFAHLFEHLMFGGSENAPDFDVELQKVGGENNAFTSPDITNYYDIVPSVNANMALFLEADRMQSLLINDKSLEIQRKVVIEEFKQRYLNQPYGDVWHKLRPLAYKQHSYKWPTIGLTIEHIEDAKLEDVQCFYDTWYSPSNATLTIAGNFEPEAMMDSIHNWFGKIRKPVYKQRFPQKEAKQTEVRFMEVESDVPFDSLYLAFHIPGRKDEGYYAADLVSEILGRGKNSRLFQRLVKKEKLVSQASAYTSGTIDPGLLIVHCVCSNLVDLKTVESIVFEEIEGVKEEIYDKELERVKNQAATALAFQEVELFNRAYLLSYGAVLGDPNWFNKEFNRIDKLEKNDLISSARHHLVKENCCVLHYKMKPL